MKCRVVAFDLDGVLVEEVSAWVTVHLAFGVSEKARENLRAYESGRIDYEEFMRRDIALWGRRTIEEIRDVLGHYTLPEGARTAVDGLKADGREVVVVSAGIDVLTALVCEDLGIPRWTANGLGVDASGVLTGEGIMRVELLRKDLALAALLLPMGIDMRAVVAVGDSKYDLPLVRACGRGIAFLPSGLGDRVVGCGVATDLREIRDIVRNFDGGAQ
jgi:phosphoserine phosphatase